MRQSQHARSRGKTIPQGELARRGLQATPKPWPGEDPWGDRDPDGEGDEKTFPENPPDSPSDNPSVRARPALLEAATKVAGTDPEAFYALLSIEARLGEIIPFLSAAIRGADGDALIKLQALSRFI